MVTAPASDQFRAELHSEGVTATGTVGTPLVIPTPGGPVTILISQLDGRPARNSWCATLPAAWPSTICRTSS